MKKLILILFLFPAHLFGQEVIDTIQHINGNYNCLAGNCEEIYNISFNNDTLILNGQIEANCAGSNSHFLIVKKQKDFITLVRLDTGQLDDSYCLYDFSLSISNCTLNEYHIVLYYYNEIALDTLAVRTMEKETPDTIKHINGECESYDDEKFNFSLSNDTLKFFGKITAHCGNCEHFLIYSRLSDTVYLTKLDTGELDDCMCIYNFDVSIPKCDKNQHRLILLDYSGNDTIIDTLISKTSTSIQIQKKNDLVIYHNPSSEKINIKFTETENNISITIFDYKGQCHFSNFYKSSDNIIINNKSFPHGIYLMRINTDNHIYNNKLIFN